MKFSLRWLQLRRKGMRLTFWLRRCYVSHRRLLALLGVLISVAFIALHIMRKHSESIPIYVIEEHYEALSYWFEAVDNELIPSEGNILIHIDGHSDESTPEYIRGMARFQYPRDDIERFLLLQRNDIFIQAAVISGFISHVVWIWPSWDKDLKKNSPSYQSLTIELGWFYNTTDGDSKSETFCQCETLDSDNLDPPTRCTYVNYTAIDAMEREVDIVSPASCHIVRKYQSEHVNEHDAVERLHEGWLEDVEETQGLILDIDEDFFGCESASRELAGSDIDWKVIENIDQQLVGLLCPKHIQHESSGDQFLRHMMRLLNDKCQRNAADGRCTINYDATVLLTESELLKEFLKHPSMFCGQNDLQVREAWQRIALLLYELSDNHFERILRLGFCLSTSPKSIAFSNDKTLFTICHGLNEPDANIIFLHTPSKAEVSIRMRTLSNIIRSLPTKPNLVTLSRSVRDGYTPRSLSGFIEDGILHVLTGTGRTGKFSSSWEVLYDDDLLGGIPGWKSRT